MGRELLPAEIKEISFDVRVRRLELVNITAGRLAVDRGEYVQMLDVIEFLTQERLEGGSADVRQLIARNEELTARNEELKRENAELKSDLDEFKESIKGELRKADVSLEDLLDNLPIGINGVTAVDSDLVKELMSAVSKMDRLIGSKSS